MFVKNLTNQDLVYKADSKQIIFPANKLTHVDDTKASAVVIKNTFMHHVEILTYEALGVVVDESTEELIEEIIEDITAEEVIEEDEIEETIEDITTDELIEDIVEDTPLKEVKTPKTLVKKVAKKTKKNGKQK